MVLPLIAPLMGALGSAGGAAAGAGGALAGLGGSALSSIGGMGGLLKLGGGVMGAQAKGASARARQKLERRRHREKVKAYNDLIGRAGGMAETGEKQFLGEYEGALPEMEAAKEALKSGQAESLQQASGQIGANLARSRVRGGQAAQAQAESVGQIAQKGLRDIDLQAYKDAQTRRGAKGQFFGTKAGTGQRGMMTAPTF